MKHTITKIVFVISFASLLSLGLIYHLSAGDSGAGLVPTAQAQADQEQMSGAQDDSSEQDRARRCSNRTLSGEYLVTGEAAARLDQSDDPSFPRRSIEVWNFDGAGNLSTFFIQTSGGVIQRGVGNHTYTVDSDRCTAAVTFGNGVQFELFLTRDGSEGAGIRIHNVVPQDRAIVATRYIKKR